VAIFYRDEERQHYRLLSHHGLPGDLAAEIATLRIGTEGPLVQYLREHQTIDKQTAQDLLPRAFFERFDVGEVAVTPLSVGDRVLGALLGLRYAGRPPFTANQLELLEGIARHVAIAVEVAGLHESVKREGEVSAALARAGRELIGSVSAPELLQRLCGLTVEALGCDTSLTFLLDPREQLYLPAAMYGLARERWESLQLLRVPAAAMTPLVERLENNEIVQLFPAEELVDKRFARLAVQYGVVAALHVGLRRGNRLIGYHVAYIHDEQRRFDRQHVDMLRGLGGLASLALENAVLVTELERANNIKSDFVATMSHELRTPLNAIIGYNALMREGEFGPLTGEQEKVCSTIARSSRTLLDLISATLDVSRLDAGHVPLTLADVSVGALLDSVRTDVALPKSRDVVLEWELAPDLPVLCTDALKLKVVVKNLVENALKFTDRGSVRVTAQRKEEGVEIAVVDTGIGISADAQKLIFEPFRQVDGSSTRRHGGVGLGLYIVRRLVGVLGGSVSLASEPGRGSTFRVWIPPAERPGNGAPTAAGMAR
jgi:signal transduction histidine kinase